MDELDFLKRLSEVCAKLARAGLSPGSSGNASARTANKVYVTRSGANLSSLEAEEFIPVDLETGELIEAEDQKQIRPTKETPLHLALYKRNPEAEVAIHLHSPAALAASCLHPYSENLALPPYTPYSVMRVGNLPLLPYATPGSADHAARVLEVPFEFNSALLANHGLIASGADVMQVYERCVEIESAANVTLLLEGKNARVLSAAECERLALMGGVPFN